MSKNEDTGRGSFGDQSSVITVRQDQDTRSPSALEDDYDDLDWAEPEQQTTRITLETLATRAPVLQEACLVVIYPAGPLKGGRTMLEKPQYIIGRSSDADIRIDRDSVSRRHAKISRRDFCWSIEDLGSTNGIFVNGKKLLPGAPHLLQDGENFRTGDTIFKFLNSGNIEAAYHEEIYRISILDGLTEAYNRRYFFEYLERECALSSRYGQPLSLVMCDLDYFKQINDNHGHPVGDLVIKEVAARVRPRVRREDCFARYGGEEFAVLLTHTDRRGALDFAESVRKLIASSPVMADGAAVGITCSFGVATSTSSRRLDSRELIKIADDNLYVAKNNGRNRVVG